MRWPWQPAQPGRFLSTAQVEEIKKQFPRGTRIQLNNMEGEDIPAGTKGTVEMIDGIGQIHMKWDNGRTLPLNPEVDDFDILSKQEKTEPDFPDEER